MIAAPSPARTWDEAERVIAYFTDRDFPNGTTRTLYRLLSAALHVYRGGAPPEDCPMTCDALQRHGLGTAQSGFLPAALATRVLDPLSARMQAATEPHPAYCDDAPWDGWR